MADNVTANAGSGGSVFAADDISSVYYPRTKIVHGADGTNDGDVSKTNGLPVAGNTAKDGSGTDYRFVVDTNGYITSTVSTIIPGTGATHLGKAIDTAVGSTDTIVGCGVVRDDALATLTPADGDWTVLRTDSTGALWCRLATATVTESQVIADDAAFTVATSKVFPAGFLADETATDSIDEGDAGAARMTLDRKQIVTPYAHAAAGGATGGHLVSAASTNATVIKASAGKLLMLTCFNLNAAARYLKFYNMATTPNPASDTVVLSFLIPGNTAGAGFVVPIPDCGIQFSTGIAFAMVTGIGDTNNTGVAASEILLSYAYA